MLGMRTKGESTFKLDLRHAKMTKNGKPPVPPAPVAPITPIAAGSSAPAPLGAEPKLNAQSPKSAPLRFQAPSLFGKAFRYRRYILGGAVVVYGASKFVSNRVQKARRDYIEHGSVIYWNVFDGGIVEEKDPSSLYVRFPLSSKYSLNLVILAAGLRRYSGVGMRQRSRRMS